MTGLLSALVLWWAFPRTYPLFPLGWETTGVEAEAIASERFRDLGELPDAPYTIIAFDTDEMLEARLQPLLRQPGADAVLASRLARQVSGWRVTIYSRTEPHWLYRGKVSPRGELVRAQRWLPDEDAAPPIDSATATERAREFLVAEGFDLADYGDAEVVVSQRPARTDLQVRFAERQRIAGLDARYGVEVTFAGDRLTGFSDYFEDPNEQELKLAIAPLILLNQFWVFLALLLTPIVAVPFVRRYHQGEIGVERGVQIAAAVVGLGLLTLLVCMRPMAETWSFGLLTRPVTTWLVFFQHWALFFVPMGIMALLSWSVGESMCRERWGDKLAAFDAVFKGSFANATVARAALRGVASGLAVLAATWCAMIALGGRASAPSFLALGPWWENVGWFSIPLVSYAIAYSLYMALFGQLLLVPSFVRKLGALRGAALAAVAAAFLFFPAAFLFPWKWGVPLWIGYSLCAVVVFMRYGIFTTFMMHLTANVAGGAIPFLFAESSAMQLQASLALLGVAAPLILSVRYLFSGEEFEYRYEDVPPHVRRIAERERQKVELETARNIQTSILPELPPEIYGVRLAASYVPATEVGGDFYDVLALEDGRLAVAVGDVAGHGVSSGLVMSMAKSALAVQVTFNPEVEAVFATLNRMVYQSARRRLLATLCYAVLDPRERSLDYASAGHLFPYRVTADRRVMPLESVSYPLGVRHSIDVSVRAANLEADDYLFLFSDGVVEGRRADSDDLYGFDRLEESLRRHAGGSVAELRDGVLDDLRAFTGGGPRDDDLTVLVLQVP